MKQRKFVLTTLGLALLLTSLAGAAEYTIDPVHSKILFKVKHLGISTVTGRFDKFSGTYEYDPKNTKAAKATATIEAASVNSDVEKRDNHLRSADFLDVQKFPKLTFTSKGIKSVGKGKFKLFGDLTIHGVTKPVVLDTDFGGVAAMGDSERSAFTASATINRRDFGLVYSKALESGGLVVGNEVRITLEIEGARQLDANKINAK